MQYSVMHYLSECCSPSPLHPLLTTNNSMCRYGGGQQVKQPWPVEKQPRQETPFVTADMLARRNLWYGGVSEAYWVSSQGVAVRVRLTNVTLTCLVT